MDLQIGSTIDHDHYGKGKVLDEQELFWTIDFGKKGIIEITKRNADMLTLSHCHEKMKIIIHTPWKN
ncbi:MAG: hypothetical protein NT084_13665 [Bacteroidetes bacterium]|nr:hypothetical protein [Bacteroidota bacterium]